MKITISRPLVIGVAAGVLIILFLAGILILRHGSRRTGRGAGPTTVGPEVRLDPTARPASPAIKGMRHSPTSIEFKLNLGDRRLMDEPLIFCIPANRQARARVRSYRLFSASTAEAADLTEQAQASEPLDITTAGIIRYWNLAALKLRPGLFEPIDAAAGEPGADETPTGVRAEAEISIEWDGPFDPGTPQIDFAELDSFSAWGRIMTLLVANPEGLRRFWIADPQLRGGINPLTTAPWKKFPGERRWARLRLTEEGLYRLRVEDLIALGVPSREIQPEAIRIFLGGKPVGTEGPAPVPLLRVGSGGAQQIYFWHAKSDSKYSPHRVYWVTLAADLPNAALDPISPDLLDGTITEQTTTTRTAIIDRDREIKIESGNFLAIQKMEWVDSPIRPNHAERAPLDLPLEFHGARFGDQALKALARFYFEGSSPVFQAKVDVRRAGEVVSSTSINSTQETTRTLDIPASLLREGRNDFTLTLDTQVKSNDARTTVWLDNFRVDYPSEPVLVDGRLSLVHPATTPAVAGERMVSATWTPLSEDSEKSSGFKDAMAIVLGPDGKAVATIQPQTREGGMGYLWPGADGWRVEVRTSEGAIRTPAFEEVQIDDLTEESEGADYLIIAHREFFDQARRIAELHQKRGLRVRIAEVQSVFDNFSGGELTPEAIRDFLAYTLRHWRGGAPGYVLLFGDATSDYLGLTRTDVRNWVPSFTFDAGADDWASDYWFGVVAGADDLIDFMIGRISVASLDDAEAVVDKIVKYAEQPRLGPWRARVGFVADDGGFIPPMEELRDQHTPAAYDETRVYLDEAMPLEDNWYLPSQLVQQKRLKVSPLATARIRDAFNQGISYITYYGHGSPNIWMEERVWFGGNSTNSDNQFLAGSGYGAFVTTMTCNTGAIDYPVPKGLPGGGWNICISEDMMRARDGGAVALYVPSGPSVTGIQHRMSIELHRCMFKEDMRRLGELVALSTARYLIGGNSRELAYMLVLLGDPAMDLLLTPATRSFELPQSAYRPGDLIEATLVDLEPPTGRYVASLEPASPHAGSKKPDREPNGPRTLWQSGEQNYSGGRIPIQLTLPSDAPLGDARLRVYAWDEKTTADLAAVAPVLIALPEIELVDARWKDGGPNSMTNATEPRINLELGNVGDIPPGSLFVVGPYPAGSPEPAPVIEKVTVRDDQTTFTLELSARGIGAREGNLNTGAGARVFDLRLWPAEWGADPIPERHRHRIVKTRLALQPSDDWIGLVPEMSGLTIAPDGRTAHLEIHGFVSASETREILVGLDALDGSRISTETIHRQSADGKRMAGFRVEMGLDQLARDRATSGTLWLAGVDAAAPTLGADAGTTETILSRVPMAEIPRRVARLRIDPESVRPVPDNPFQGQTIHFQFNVENIGDAASSSFTAGLFDQQPYGGGQLLFDYINGKSQTAGESLLPGEVRPLTLRWDPSDNAGEKIIWFRIDPQQGRGDSTESDLQIPYTIRVRTKANLVRGATKIMPGSEAGTFVVTGEASNEGETEANNVLVVFYSSSAKTPETEIGRVLLPVIEGNSREVAKITWKPGNLPAGAPDPQPVHELRLNWRRTFGPPPMAPPRGNAP